MKSKPLSKIIPCFLAVIVLLSGAATRAENFSQYSARTSPQWLRDGVIYEIFPRDFSAQGDLNGVTAQLDRLKDLGVTILWTMPVHPIGEKFRKGAFGSPYAIKDYYAVDPHYGTVDDYKRLVAEAHKRGLKVIMDLVADHTSWDAVMMAHPEFYKHDAQGKIISPVPEWTDVAALNYDCPALRRYMITMLEYWIQNCDVDGFRCDAASMVPTDFWEQVRADLTTIKPDIILLAEASKPELMVNAFDIDYSWPLLGSLAKVLGNNAPASTLRRSWEKSRAEFPKDALSMRISDDHDEGRAISRYGADEAVAASVLMFTLDGVPLIYNGMEVGDEAESNGGALFEKRTISWTPNEHPSFRNTYHDLIEMRRTYPAFRNSRVEWISNSDESRLLTFLRSDANDELLVAINFSSNALTGTVNVRDGDRFVPLAISGMGNSDAGLPPTLHLKGFEWRIFHRAAGSLPPQQRIAAKAD